MQAAGGTALSESAAAPPVVRDTRGRRIGVLLTVATAVLAADVATKALIVSALSDRPPIRLLGGALLLREARNSGAAFSIAQGATVVFTLVAVVVIVVIARTARRLRSLGWAVVLGLLLGGAAGNLVDRLFRAPGPLRGAVVDWIDLRVWPVFNLADSAIVVGGIVAVLLSLRGSPIDGGWPARREDDPGAGSYSRGA